MSVRVWDGRALCAGHSRTGYSFARWSWSKATAPSNEITCVKNFTTSHFLFQIYFHKTTQTRLSAVATAQAGNHATRFARQVDCGLYCDFSMCY